MYLLQLLDWYAASMSVILVCLVEVVIVSYVYGIRRFVFDVEFMIGNKIGKWWCICWKYITPVILSVSLNSIHLHLNAFGCIKYDVNVRFSILCLLSCLSFNLQFIFVTTILFNTQVTYNKMAYPQWMIHIGWGSCLSSIICIPIYIIYKLSRMNGSLKKVRHC